MIREALARLLPDQQWPQARLIGGWWPRTNQPELDLVAADREPARVISFVGSIKWLEGDGNAFGTHDYAALARDALAVPGANEKTPLIAVSRSGCTIDAPAAVYEPEQLIQAWA